MHIIECARAFVKGLRSSTDPRRCPYCYRCLTKKHGFYKVTVRNLGGLQQQLRQRYWCHLCRRSYSPPDPQRCARARYTRCVQRKALDLYFHVGASLRLAAEWLRSEINGCSERALIWDPLLSPPSAPQRGVRLCHTTIWRWKQRLAQRGQTQAQRGGFQRLIRFSGALVADATGVRIRGVSTPLHLIADAVTRVGMAVSRLNTESERAIAGQFRLVLARWGLVPEEVRVLVSDGAVYYRYVLERLLRWAKQQRSVFHLWRNLSSHLQAFARQATQEALEKLLSLLHAVWDAPCLPAAQEAFLALQEAYAHCPSLQGVLQIVGQSLSEALLHTSGVVQGMGRTSNVAERFFRRYKQRVRCMGCFMSEAGCDAFNFLWQIYINWEPYQVRHERKRHYRHPGMCPFQVAGVDTQGLSWLDALGV